MSLTAKITTEDIRLTLNGTYTAPNYQFWGQNFNSGSVLANVNRANIYMYSILGEDIMDSTDVITSNHVWLCQLDLSCAYLLTVLTGDVITNGMSLSAGLTIQQPLLLASYRTLQEAFMTSAQLHMRLLQPLFVTEESDVTNYRTTSPSVM